MATVVDGWYFAVRIAPAVVPDRARAREAFSAITRAATAPPIRDIGAFIADEWSPIFTGKFIFVPTKTKHDAEAAAEVLGSIADVESAALHGRGWT